MSAQAERSSDPWERLDEHRDELEDLAERDDLRVSKYAQALLEAAETEG